MKKILALPIPTLAAVAASLGFFFLLLWFYVTNVYQLHFFDKGGIVIAYQFARVLYIPCLVWLQYAVGAYALRWLANGMFPLAGLGHFIASFLLGTSLWHIALLGVGLAGFYHYPVMLFMVGAVMIASTGHLANVFSKFSGMTPNLARDEKIMSLLVIAAALLFLFFKATYPGGGHDYFNHYHVYYKEVIESGSLGPHATWYQYFYSKGVGLYFLSMILLDPLAVHLAASSLIVVAVCIVYDLLRKAGQSRLLPLFGVFLYLMCYIYTSGRGLFAANGGWGDLEKTHELTAVFLLGIVWVVQKLFVTRSHYYAAVLYALAATTVILGFAAGLVAGVFFTLLILWGAARKDIQMVRYGFFAGVSTATAMLAIMLINYLNTGLPLDQMVHIFWKIIDWRKVLEAGYSFELFSLERDITIYIDKALPLIPMLPKMLVEYYRLYMFWPLFAVAALLYLTRRSIVKVEGAAVIFCFLLAGYLFACVGGRSQFISFFRFSTFNYAPVLILCLLIWRVADLRFQRYAIAATLSVGAALVVWGATISPREEGKVTFPIWAHFKVGQWEELAKSAYAYNTGEASLYDAIRNQRGRVGRMKWGGIHPAMPVIYNGLPAKTRVWSLYNHSYCLLPTCNVQQYYSQVTSPRWYDIALGNVAEGKKIMQEEGLNFFYYSRNINTVFASDTKDQLITYYPGFFPQNIEKTFGILWSNGWDYLLTWKDQSVRPLDKGFMESWKSFYNGSVEPRKDKLPVEELAKLVKKATEEPTPHHPPTPPWMKGQ